jgi:hypothetical protein
VLLRSHGRAEGGRLIARATRDNCEALDAPERYDHELAARWTAGRRGRTGLNFNPLLRRVCFRVRLVKRLGLLLTLTIVVAALTAGSSAAADSVSSNWAGYAIADSSTVQTGSTSSPLTFTSVTATWKQPKARCTAGNETFSAFWVGLGGYADSAQALEQIGTSSDCSAAGKARYYAWYELVPAASIPVSLKILPGDLVTASVNVNGTNVLVQVKNRTRKTSFTKALTMVTPDLTSAEWIAEAPSACTLNGACRMLPLSNFGSVVFDKIAAIADNHPGTITDPTWEPALIRLVSSTEPGGSSAVGATPAQVSADGRRFAVSWVAAAS